MKHDDNFHKHMSHEMDSIKRGLGRALKKMDEILDIRDQVRDNTKDIGWMKKIGTVLFAALGLSRYIK